MFSGCPSVLEDIKLINSKNARNIKTFDFCNLYTKNPLDDLKEKLKEIVDKAFKGGHNKYIQITSKTARWFHSKKNESFTKEDIFSMIDLVIDHSFFKFGDKVFRQSIGIPMGIDPAPQMANLYLYYIYYEAKFMEMLTKENYSAAKLFNYTRRFIDDLHTLNNDGHLEEHNNMGRIYLPELKLNQENQNDDKATFLDLEEQIKDACIKVKTYDKRDAFEFEIINYPDLSGNIPTKPAYGVFTSQVIRYARICSKKDAQKVKSLTKKLLRKHYTINGPSHHWRNVWRYIAGSWPNWAQDFNRTSQNDNRTSQKNNYQHSRIFGTSWLLLITPTGNPRMFLPITQASRCTIGWSDSGCWGADTS